MVGKVSFNGIKGRMRAIFITRSDISWYSKNANVYQKSYQLSCEYDLTLCVSQKCGVPGEISSRVSRIVRFKNIFDFLFPNRATRIIEKSINASALIFTGFDFPCMWVGWRLKRKMGSKWTVFCWDPPSLSHRDRFPLLRWMIDFLFRWFLRRCDRLVLNVHPGLLDEIGYKPREGQLECRMQDAFEGLVPAPIADSDSFEYDFGVLSNWKVAKGAELMAEVMRCMPDKTCLWIGDPPPSKNQTTEQSSISFAGRLGQEEAFEKLRKCRVLVAPYLNVPSLKWNYVLKLFEYLKLGRPILASDNPGNAAVAQKYPGRIILFQSGLVEDFVRKARTVL